MQIKIDVFVFYLCIICGLVFIAMFAIAPFSNLLVIWYKMILTTLFAGNLMNELERVGIFNG